MSRTAPTGHSRPRRRRIAPAPTEPARQAPATVLYPTGRSSVSVTLLRRITPKKALVGGVLAAATTGMVFAAAPAQAAPASDSAKAVAQRVISDAGQFQCFDKIVSHESGWNVTATNSSSGAYGLVQALPGSKMASAGADWKTNAETQIKWGHSYMKERYGSPCGAWSHWQANGWY
ncbi:lytic transglycosylase domain-containing protein [Streptomyces spectabilis]|uniref:Lytic transglycosylase domain-containing protein n=1 Tax=Streptomyces spectabilis TaxID=68270 RepID=A0A5P2X9I3_STRST|nr:lytic transglycosylase domain-containing protein [Streptomyces spectabilis]